MSLIRSAPYAHDVSTNAEVVMHNGIAIEGLRTKVV